MTYHRTANLVPFTATIAAAALALAIFEPLVANVAALRPLAAWMTPAYAGTLALFGLLLGAHGLRAVRAAEPRRPRALRTPDTGAAPGCPGGRRAAA